MPQHTGKRLPDPKDPVQPPLPPAPPPPIEEGTDPDLNPAPYRKDYDPKKGKGGGGGGGAGGGGGGGGSNIGSGGYVAANDPHSDLNLLIKKNVMDRISGKSRSFSADIVSKMKQKLFESTQGQVSRAKQGIYSDAVRRGLFRSGTTSKGISMAENAGIKAYSSGVREILIQKAMADWQDMVKAVDSAQQWLNGVRQYELGKEQNAIAREQIKATLAAAAMQAGASRYAADQALKGALAGAGRKNTGSYYVDSTGSYVMGPDGNPLTINQVVNQGSGE